MKHPNVQLMALCCCLFFTAAFSCYAAEQINVPVSSGDEITIEHFPADGQYLMLWFAPEYGLRNAHRSLAQALSKQHIEVWLSNLQESLFLPNSSRAIKQLDGSHVAELIDYAHKTTGKKIVLAGDSYASVIALRGAHQWQQKHQTRSALIGAILFSPYTYASIPPLGQLPEYLPIVSATNIPLMIYQANHSAIISQFDTLLEKLRQNGSPVYTRYTSNIMSLFYEPEPTEHMKKEAAAIPASIRKIIPVLEKHTMPAQPVALKSGVKSGSGIDTELRAFRGIESPLAIRLEDLNGNTFIKNNFNGKVTLINFWATWCPPCIEEIPSLNRLKAKMQGLPFEIISINYAEEKTAIVEFMDKVKIDFPVLLDRDGNFARQWNVISYPSTFIIDPDGKIKYGINAAIQWDSPEFIEKIKALYSSTTSLTSPAVDIDTQ